MYIFLTAVYISVSVTSSWYSQEACLGPVMVTVTPSQLCKEKRNMLSLTSPLVSLTLLSCLELTSRILQNLEQVQIHMDLQGCQPLRFWRSFARFFMSLRPLRYLWNSSAFCNCIAQKKLYKFCLGDLSTRRKSENSGVNRLVTKSILQCKRVTFGK